MMRASLITDVDTLVLDGAPDVRATEVWGIVKDGLQQFWGGVEPRVDDLTRPDQDGEFWPSRLLMGARYVTVLGAHRSHDSSVAEDVARDRIAGMLRRRIDLCVEGALGPRWAAGFISQRPEFTRIDDWTCKFGFVLKCPDPLWYGAPVTTSGKSVFVENNGNAEAWPTTITLTGVGAHAEVISQGHRVTYDGPSVSRLVLSPRSATAVADGVDARSRVEDDFFQIPPGGAQVTVTGASGAEVESRSAWL